MMMMSRSGKLKKKEKETKRRKGNSLNANWQQRNQLTDWLRVRQWDSEKSEKKVNQKGEKLGGTFLFLLFSRTSCASALRARKTGRQYSIHNLLNSLFFLLLLLMYFLTSSFSSLCTHRENETTLPRRQLTSWQELKKMERKMRWRISRRLFLLLLLLLWKETKSRAPLTN